MAKVKLRAPSASVLTGFPSHCHVEAYLSRGRVEKVGRTTLGVIASRGMKSG